jgi:NAD(P)-dependent dehydrogenase (short-subunit alcohol dehydrogenase family)
MATPVRADATKEDDVVALFEQVAAAAGTLDVAIYNTGNNTPGRIVDMEARYFERAWRLGAFGGFLFGREALRRMLPNKSGTLLYTGASGSMRGRAGYGAFNSSKAALRNLAMAMAKEYAADGIHVAHVVVDGGIAGDKIIQRVPEMVERMGMDGLISLDGLAEAYWFLHQQPPQAWTFELDQRTHKEQW